MTSSGASSSRGINMGPLLVATRKKKQVPALSGHEMHLGGSLYQTYSFCFISCFTSIDSVKKTLTVHTVLEVRVKGTLT